MDPRRLLLIAILLSPAVLAGCLGSGDAGEGLGRHGGAGRDGGSGGGDDDEPEPPRRRDGDKRWHYHDYWGGDATIVLLARPVELPLVSDREVHAAARTPGAEFTLPHGTIVPPETGELNVTVNFTRAPGVPFTGLNLSWMTAGGTTFASLPVEPGGTVSIPVGYDQTDVPHRGSSAWRFRLEPRADGGGAAIANGTAEVTVVARIGRPLLIDPPHFDRWNGRDVLPLAAANATLTVVKLTEDRYVEAVEDGAETRAYVAEVRLANGSLVPQGAKDVRVALTWNASQGSAPLGLAYEELNSPSNGTLDPEVDEVGRRVFRVPVGIGMSDSPYANQSTWRFFVLVDGANGSAFAGDVTLVAWAERRATTSDA